MIGPQILPTSDEVHVWQANLDLSPVLVERRSKLLSEEELERSNRFHFPIHRNRFVAARSTLRMLLGSYLAEEPARVRIATGGLGKPRLEAREPDLRFNLSHSEGKALYAMTLGREVGIDIESLDRVADVPSAGGSVFSEAERRAILTFPLERRREAFFAAWVRKEAWIKGTGRGWAAGTEAFEVPVDPDFPGATLLRQGSPWLLLSLRINPAFAAALAVAGETARVSIREVLILEDPAYPA